MPARSRHIIQITGRDDGTYTLYKGCTRIASRDEMDLLIPHAVAVINRTAIEALQDFAVHASVVAMGESVVAFPSESGGGKSTIAAAAVLNGFSYLSDEALVLDDDGWVTPYPKPMALSRASCEILGLDASWPEQLFVAGDLGGASRTRPGKLTDLVIAEFGSSGFHLERRPSSEAVAQLIAKSFNHYLNPQGAFELTTALARDLRVWRLTYDDPAEAVRKLSEAL